MPKMRQRTAIVVGAGVGGVATAARLAKAGLKVTVVEKNSFTGGRCSLIYHEGFRFDQGPSLLLLPRLFQEAFHNLDTSLEAEDVELIKYEPNYNMWFGNGELFELSSDLVRMKIEIERYEGKDRFERYLEFLQESHRHYEISVKHVLHANFTSLFSMLRPSFLKHLLELYPFECSVHIWKHIYGYESFEAPGTYSLLQYTELAEGIWYPRGGFHKVVDALVKVGQRLGVEYRMSCPVSSIDISVDGNRACGITLASGEKLKADVLISNADLVYCYEKLLPPSSYAKSLKKQAASCCSISFYWAMDRTIPELKAHNIFLADNYRASFDSIFKDQQLPAEPSFYINVPSRVDPSAAPPGKDAVVVLCPVGHLLNAEEGKGLNPRNTQDWQAMIDRARWAILETIEERTGASISSFVINEIINILLSWKKTFNLDKGAILGLSHSFFNVLCFRPSTQHSSINDLYFVGASTHPGTGVPIVLAGSKITSTEVL